MTTVEQDQALAMFAAARDLFQNGDYQGALDQMEKALALSPKDPVMQEFRGQQVATLQPDDQLASQLLQGLNSAGQPPPEPGAPAQPIEARRLAGDWNASRPDGSTFEMELTPDKHFTWTYSQQDPSQKLRGTYSLADDYLILKASDQETLIGQVAFQEGGKMLFQLAGNNPADPGLLFSK